MTRHPIPLASLAIALLLLTGTLGAPTPGAGGAGDTSALRDALALHEGFLVLAPGDDATLHGVFTGSAPDAEGFAALVPAGWSLVLHGDQSPQRMRLPVSSYTDVDDLTEAQRDGVPALPEDAVGIGPGTPLLVSIPGEGTFICTANYVFEDGSKVYLGSAGHCFLFSGATATHGPGANYNPQFVVVEACVDFCFFGGQLTGFLGDFVRLGPVAYARQTGSGGDIGNDFGVVEIPADAQQYVRAEMPMWDGPTGTRSSEGTGSPLVHYGNGIDSGTFMATKGRAGTSLNDGDFRSWQALVSINGGDSGSAINHAALDADEVVVGTEALGVVTHGLIVPGVPIGWGTSIHQALTMATEANLNLDILLEGETLSGGGGGGGSLTSVHVDAIDTAFSHYGRDGHRVDTTVVVKDASGAAASGVTVDVEATAPDGTKHAASGSTDTAGSVVLTVQQKGGGHGTWTSCVTALSGTGYQHDATADRETCESIVVS